MQAQVSEWRVSFAARSSTGGNRGNGGKRLSVYSVSSCSTLFRVQEGSLNQGAGQPGSLCQLSLVAVTGHEAGVSRDNRERYVQSVK